jgi:hypothetical protein
MNEPLMRGQVILDCIQVVEAEEELLGPMPERNLKLILENPENACRAAIRSAKASIALKLQEMLHTVPKSYFLIAYEIQAASGGPPRRANEAIEGCPAVWWAGMLQRSYDAFASRREEARRHGLRTSLPTDELRFLSATPITKAGYEAVS